MSLILPKVKIEPAKIDWTGLPTGYLNGGELEVLVTLVRSVSPRAVIEFGCNEGRTAKALLRHVPEIEQYVGVDVLPGYVFQKSVQKGETPARPGHLAIADERFELRVSARGSFDLTAADLPVADAVFIDGDHGERAVRHDTALALELLRPGGIIIWHDYHDLGVVDVRDVLHAFAADGMAIQHVEGTWIAYCRKE